MNEELWPDQDETGPEGDRIPVEGVAGHGRCGESAHVEQIHQLAEDQHIHRRGAGDLQALAAHQLPLVDPEGQGNHQHAHKDDAHEHHPGDQRLFRRARRTAHHALLRRLEGERQRQRDGGDHVDPEDLAGGDRQGHAGEHRDQDDTGLRPVGRQDDDQRFMVAPSAAGSRPATAMVRASTLCF